MAELADALDLGSSSKEWGFKSLCPHQTLINKEKQPFSLCFFYYVKYGFFNVKIRVKLGSK